MASATKWSLKRYQTTWLLNDKTIWLETDRPCHLFMRWSPLKPVLSLKTVIRRGIPVQCQPTWTWHQSSEQEQQELGDTLGHTFVLPDWLDGATRYYFFYGDIAGVSSPSNTAIFTEQYWAPPGPPPPQPTPTWYEIPTTAALLAAPNRYSFWANGFWYVVIPFTSSISIWKLVGGFFTRQDPVNEPIPPLGIIRIADARVYEDSTTIAVAYFSQSGSLAPTRISYSLYNALTDTWGATALAASGTHSGSALKLTSLSLTPSAIPHIVYSHITATSVDLWYVHKETGAWSAPIVVARVFPNSIVGACLDHAYDTSLHLLAAATNNRVHWRKRPALGPWGILTQIQSLRNSANMHHILHAATIPHFATNETLSAGADHGEAEPPPAWQLDVIIPPGFDPHTMTPSGADPPALFLAKDSVANIRRATRPSGGAWTPDILWLNWPLITLTVSPASDSVFSILTNRAAPANPRFQAFTYPWL